jgi:hypothetical protein
LNLHGSNPASTSSHRQARNRLILLASMTQESASDRDQAQGFQGRKRGRSGVVEIAQDPWRWEALPDGRVSLTLWTPDGRRAVLEMTRAEADEFCDRLGAAAAVAQYLDRVSKEAERRG